MSFYWGFINEYQYRSLINTILQAPLQENAFCFTPEFSCFRSDFFSKFCTYYKDTMFYNDLCFTLDLLFCISKN